ncbi:hypothetical protein C1645_776563 [Glomus cerebriforme]|uniref:Transcription factor TFIIB cyclin-like domain-containing protein n=1 Tax=Glomus cerebriforme TaxID=658196 RepID=A0A397SPY7_9GLOM|nr:hypothetical protein C1645_776563 [Glomus cerebriforme]
MTQERVNNSYAFVMEDPSKPRKYQLNFQLNDNHQYKEPTHIQSTMDQNIASHQPHNPQHHSLHHNDFPRPASITLPSIKELMQIPQSPVPPPPSLPQSHRILQHQHQQYLQNHHNHNILPQHKSESLTTSTRPHLPPLPETSQNLSNFNYPGPFNTTSRNDNRNERIDSHLQISHHSQQQHSSHSLPQHTHQHPLMSSSSEISSYYQPHSSSYPSQSTNSTQYPVNHKINQIPPSQHHSHYQQPPPLSLHQSSHQPQRSPPRQIQQVHPQQMQTSQRMSHHNQPHHHHIIHQPLHHLQAQPQQQVQQGYHHSSSLPPPPPSSHHPHVFSNNNEIGSQHDHQPSAASVAATSRVPYNYYSQSQGYSNPPIISSAPSHVSSSHNRNVQLTEYPTVRDATLTSEQQHHQYQHHQQQQQQQQNGISGHMQQQYPPPQHLQHPQVQQQQQSMYMHQQQQQQHQQPQVSHLQVPQPNISRPLTPPQLNLPPQQPQQIQNQFSSENRETSPFHLVPPPHHHSGSNSSVSTRSSSPAPSTPIASNNLPFSPNGGVPVNNLVHNNNMDKPLEQNVSVKKKGRSKPPKPILPAGPIPNQQPISSNQSLPTNTSNDPLVIVQYPNPSNNNNNNNNNNYNNNNNNNATKAPPVSRSRKNSISNVPASISKRGRKAKDTSSSTKVAEEVYNVNNNISSGSISVPENNEKNAAQNRKREYSSSNDNQNSKRYKKGEELLVVQDNDDVMEDATHNEKEEESNMDIDDDERKEEAKLLLSLKDNNNTTTVENTVAIGKPGMESTVSKDIKIKEEYIVNKVVTPIIEPIITSNNVDIKLEPVDQVVTKKVKEMSIKEEEKQSYTHEKKAASNSPKKLNDIVKSEIPEKNNIPSTRVFTNKVQDKKERNKIASIESDSDSDLAMDDGSDDDVVDQNKKPENNFSIDGNAQWNSDDMETEEEVEEEIEIFPVSSLNHDSTVEIGNYKQNNVNSSLNVTNHQKSNDDVKETNSTINPNSSNKKSSRPESPISSCFTTTNSGILSRKASTSSSISRKGSTSSNGSNKEKDNVIFGSPIEAPISSPIPSPPLVKTAADSGNSTTTTNGNTNSKQRPCPPRRRSTMRDDEKLELNAIEWEKNIEIPHSIWVETLRVFEIVKHSKEMKNRQPHRKRNHILASILFILCRQNGLPRTFVEICNAASIRKQEIGTYYRLMLKVFESNGLGDGSNGTVDSAEYLKRWCQNLKLPSHILSAAIHVYRQASELNITTGKCPVSVGAASIWLSIHSWNEIRISTYSHTHTDDAALIKVEHKDVATAAGVVNATLVGCFKNLLKFKESLLPEGFLKEARERSPFYLKPNSTGCANNNSENDTYGRLPSSLDNVKSYGSPKSDNCENGKLTGETTTVELKAESISKPVKNEPIPVVLNSPTKSQVKIERSETNTQLLKSPVKEIETSTNVDKVQVKNERFSPVLKSPPRVTKTIPEIEPGQEDADDELEEGELREDDDDMMMD